MRGQKNDDQPRCGWTFALGFLALLFFSPQANAQCTCNDCLIPVYCAGWFCAEGPLRPGGPIPASVRELPLSSDDGRPASLASEAYLYLRRKQKLDGMRF